MRHTRCALVTGVQSCALPIWFAMQPEVAFDRLTRHATQRARQRGVTRAAIDHLWSLSDQEIPVAAELHVCSIPRSAIAEAIADRSEERRVGKECVSTCRSRWSAYP